MMTFFVELVGSLGVFAVLLMLCVTGVGASKLAMAAATPVVNHMVRKSRKNPLVGIITGCGVASPIAVMFDLPIWLIVPLIGVIGFFVAAILYVPDNPGPT